ncbi:hypothetical protein [Streptomyces sp. NPDC006997]|uniref:hypothetical protein n=1 Tax=Streptomyces sp. NPDC006997 TaxID=3155356 RepID=UPI0033DD43CD
MAKEHPSEIELGRERALHPVAAAPGVLVHSGSDRRLAVEQWLLAALDGPRREAARREWQTMGLAMLPLGVRYSAVRIPGRLVHLAVDSEDPHRVDEVLAEALGGPVICDLRHPRYYALVPRVAPPWASVIEHWHAAGIDVLGSGCLLGVPPVEAEGGPGAACSSYWAVPMPSLGELCDPLAVEQLVTAGLARLVRELGV